MTHEMLIYTLTSAWLPQQAADQPERLRADVRQILEGGNAAWPETLKQYIDERMPGSRDTAMLQTFVQSYFPKKAHRTVAADVSRLIKTDDWTKAVKEYLKAYVHTDKDPAFVLTFQEMTEILHLLPKKAPKELKVKLVRDQEGHLLMEYLGKINVPSVSGREPTDGV